MTGFHSKQDMAAGKQKEYDPCPGCIVGTVCRTPNCGRLKLPVDHPFRNTKAALIASIIACRDMLDAQPVPARKYAPTDPFERWWYYESIGTPNDEHTKRMCQIAWSNGAYLAAQPAQEPVAWTLLLVGEHHGVIGKAGEQFLGHPKHYERVDVYTAPPQREWIWLSDADIAEVVDTTCQYTGSYEEYLIKKAERKIRSMNI
jgi:hypothetical protein